MTSYKIKKDYIHSDYFILAIGLSLAASLYLLFLNQPNIQIGIVIATGLFYILWAVIHHAREGDIHPKVILEYTLIAALAIALMLTLIIRT